MRFFLWSCVLLAALASSALSAQSLQAQLTRFNNSPAWEGVSSDENNAELIGQFRGKPFVCSNASDYTPQDSAAASRAFSDFVEYGAKGDRIQNFWDDAGHKQKRESLLASAVKAGSWKAVYVDSVWSLRYPKAGESHETAVSHLESLVRQGIPLAAYKYATYLFGRDDKTMYELLDQAIQRGSPEAMELVGTTIVIQSKELRPVGKAMLDCALSQGHAGAYAALGQLADMEGRRVDAYRLWLQGANKGCNSCAQSLESFAKIRNGYTVVTPMSELEPELTRIEEFDSDNILYQLSELPDLSRPLPPELAFHFNDEDLLKLLELERAERARSTDGP